MFPFLQKKNVEKTQEIGIETLVKESLRKRSSNRQNVGFEIWKFLFKIILKKGLLPCAGAELVVNRIFVYGRVRGSY